MAEAQNVVVIGAGIGGLTTAALLAKAGLDVTVLEAHIYPGGCAGTFYHKGYRFDAGATLAGGFYPGGPMDLVAQAVGIPSWPIEPPSEAKVSTSAISEPAMTVHMPSGEQINRYGDDARWLARRDAFGTESERFWRWQESTADLLWDLALKSPPWPPQSVGEASQLFSKGASWLTGNLTLLRPNLLPDLFRSVKEHLNSLPEKLRLFVDAQLLIASQTTSAGTNALYGASALDLPKRGVVHLQNGIGAIAETLVQAVRDNGGSVYYRQEVSHIVTERNRRGQNQPVAVRTKRGKEFEADLVVANLPPWNIRKLLREESTPKVLQGLGESPTPGGGAFMTYVGLESGAIPPSSPLHHQVIIQEPMGEGNTVFLSLSPEWDTERAPPGHRALTISTHTHIEPWWQLYRCDIERYEQRKKIYTDRLVDAAERVFPHLRSAADLVKPGTPVTFQRFTRREKGWVGGFPQTSLFNNWGPKLAPGLWMVGDTIFPGQSTAAVALGGMRVAHSIMGQQSERLRQSSPLPNPASLG